jgi:hypothetical protein
MNIDFEKGEVKENEIIEITFVYNDYESNPIREINPLCDCITYTIDKPNTYHFSFKTDPIPSNKEFYETIKIIVLKYKDDNISFLNIKCKVTK